MKEAVNLEELVWYRLLKVLRIGAYLLLPYFMYLVFTNYAYELKCFGLRFETCESELRLIKGIASILLTSLVYVFIVELIKRVVVYVVLGKRNEGGGDRKGMG
ncbi:MAG: hypothetical protein AAB783_01130 [Patescibacteria group bacterium]